MKQMQPLLILRPRPFCRKYPCRANDIDRQVRRSSRSSSPLNPLLMILLQNVRRDHEKPPHHCLVLCHYRRSVCARSDHDCS